MRSTFSRPDFRDGLAYGQQAISPHLASREAVEPSRIPLERLGDLPGFPRALSDRDVLELYGVFAREMMVTQTLTSD
jgi:hypothetical protein